jgi:hypothetical protein
MMSRLLSAAMVFVLASVASAQTIIYQDYTSGFSTVLPAAITSGVDTIYNTHYTGSYRFGVDWNGDANDTFTINFPNQVSILAENNASFCNPLTAQTQIVFGPTGVHQCNYTVSWTVGFFAILTVTYDSSNPDVAGYSDALSVQFINTIIVGDPQFVGLRGQSYQVHGIDGAVYNIVSEKESQVNARFVFLTQGKCPIIDGTAADNCWSHPGSYLGEMSFQQLVDGKLHQALVVAGPSTRGFASVQVDGQLMKVGDVLSISDSFAVAFTSAYSVQVTVDHFTFDLSNSDLFINQAVRATQPLNRLRAHGLLGQTHSSQTYASPLKYIAGQVDDYVIQDSDIYGSDFVYNQFKA